MSNALHFGTMRVKRKRETDKTSLLYVVHWWPNPVGTSVCAKMTLNMHFYGHFSADRKKQKKERSEIPQIFLFTKLKSRPSWNSLCEKIRIKMVHS